MLSFVLYIATDRKNFLDFVVLYSRQQCDSSYLSLNVKNISNTNDVVTTQLRVQFEVVSESRYDIPHLGDQFWNAEWLADDIVDS